MQLRHETKQRPAAETSSGVCSPPLERTLLSKTTWMIFITAIIMPTIPATTK